LRKLPLAPSGISILFTGISYTTQWTKFSALISMQVMTKLRVCSGKPDQRRWGEAFPPA
jgi:hypothetical protein